MFIKIEDLKSMKKGTTKETTKFLWWPLKVKGGYLWWVEVTMKQELVEDIWGDRYWKGSSVSVVEVTDNTPQVKTYDI